MERIKEGNFFAFSDFDLAALDQALAARKQYLLVKLHPWEMKLFSDFHLEAKHVAFLNNSDLLAKKLDLYEILGATDFLMTDFSSIYFDYLHLDKPLIFITNYLAQYEKTRGFLLGPYEKKSSLVPVWPARLTWSSSWVKKTGMALSGKSGWN